MDFDIVLKTIGVAVAAAITENLLFVRAIGWNDLEPHAFSRSHLPVTALSVTLVSMLAACCGWLGKFLIDEFYPVASHLRPPVYLLLYTAVVFLFLAVWYKIPALSVKKLELHPSLVFGFIPLAIMMIIGTQVFTFVGGIIYGFGAGLGYLLAALLSRSLNRYLELQRVPFAMRGAPVTLLYFGILSLALFGVLGHQVAV
ncbi:MAG: Rnf-Nqr domain containing protein [Angelakisella sp.]|nr:Rnf-Nqr domain containing protein [Angelakisella sp.]